MCTPCQAQNGSPDRWDPQPNCREIKGGKKHNIQTEKPIYSNKDTHTYIKKNAKRMAYPAPAPMDAVESGMHMRY